MNILGIFASRFTPNNIAISHLTTPFVSVYPFTNGFGTKYANPASLPTSTGNDVAFTKSGKQIAVAVGTNPGFATYPFSSGFGTRYAQNVTGPTAQYEQVVFSNTETYIYAGYSVAGGGQYDGTWLWGNNGFGMFYTIQSPGRPSPVGKSASDWNSDDTVQISGQDGTNRGGVRILASPIGFAGYGTNYAAPATLPPIPYGISISPQDNVVAMGSVSTPFINTYAWNNTTGWGTRFANPATLPTGAAGNIKFSPSGNDIAVAHATSPYITVYPWSAGFGTKYANPATLPTGTATKVAFTRLGNVIAVSHSSSPRVTAYPWNSGFGTKYADPATLPTGNGTGVSFG